MNALKHEVWLMHCRTGVYIDQNQAEKSPIIETITKINEELIKKRKEAFNTLKGPRLGDYLQLEDGSLTRFTYDWRDYDGGIQVGGGSDSYYLCDNGKASYSGGLDPSIDKELIHPTEKTKKGRFWIFSEDHSGAYRSIHFELDCRVYELKGGVK